MDLKEAVLSWFEVDEDRITEEDCEALFAAFADQPPEVLRQLRHDRMVQLVAAVIQARPGMKFHDLKNFYPFPSSAEVKAAQASLDPNQSAEVSRTHQG